MKRCTHPRRRFLKTFVGVAVAASLRPSKVRSSDGLLNVLFIAVDDLRPEMGCYGVRDALTPNIDRLASQGLVFRRAYCQFPSCSPSRSSLLTGLRPDTTRIFDNDPHIRQALPEVITLPQRFKQQGYHTQMLGKVLHNYGSGHDHEWWADRASWSVPDWCPDEWEYFTPEGDQLHRAGKGLVIQAPNLSDNRFYDGAVGDKAIQVLNEIRNRPFFLGVGFKRPHLPWVAPKRFFDHYVGRKIKICMNRRPPQDAPPQDYATTTELRGYEGVPKRGDFTDEQAHQFRVAYLACVSFVDAQIGRILAELERLGLADKTLVVLWGDQGYHLGEQGQWCKGSNYEASVRVPLIVSVPGMRTAGARTASLIELVDLYPTLCEICSVPLPKGLEGTSFVPLLEDPKRPWKKATFSQAPAPHPSNPPNLMYGRSIRTNHYRLIELVPFSEWKRPGQSQTVYELYQYDAELTEKVNLAHRAEYADIRRKLTAQLHAGWREAVPAPTNK